MAVDGGSGTSRGHAPNCVAPTSGPALLCFLAGHTEPDRDLGPRIPDVPEPRDGLGDRLVQLGGESGHVGQGVNVTGCLSPGVGAYGAANERGVLVILDRPSSLGVNLVLTLDRPLRLPVAVGWSAVVGAICLLLPPRPREGGTAWGLHPIGAEVVEPGVEVKLRLLDALDR